MELYFKKKLKRDHPVIIPAKFGCDWVNGIEGDVV